MKKPYSSSKKMVPPQIEGKTSSASHEAEAATREESLQLFATAKKRLMQINNWHDYSGTKLVKACLTDKKGNKIYRDLAVKDFIRVDLLGPGGVAGDGYDWLQIEALQDKSNPNAEEEMFSFVIRPSQNPASDNNETAHFYTDAATNTFIIERKGNKVIASVIGRNEKANTQAEKMTDKIRNIAVTAASALGFSSIQWKLLLKGILSENTTTLLP